MSLEILFDTVLRLSPYDLQILFRDSGCVPCRLVSASTFLISAIHFSMTVASKSPILSFACVLLPRSPEEGGLGFFFSSFRVSGHRGFHAIFKRHDIYFYRLKMTWNRTRCQKGPGRMILQKPWLVD